MPPADDFIDWKTKTGTYRYWFVPDLTADRIVRLPGNYMFVKPTLNGWVPGLHRHRRGPVGAHLHP